MAPGGTCATRSASWAGVYGVLSYSVAERRAEMAPG